MELVLCGVSVQFTDPRTLILVNHVVDRLTISSDCRLSLYSAFLMSLEQLYEHYQ